MLFCMRMNAYIMHGKNDVKNKKKQGKIDNIYLFYF